ncbi:unnamed protein product [Anisakis simplex]|uniref:Protein ECT2 (inferred by orthology to a human protein) n=1 Tax=Anisakis simplex TaxID=6269 RepID=A0A0M3K406_ANISI|nr:unnamed protein product [Anisakis simplex]
MEADRSILTSDIMDCNNDFEGNKDPDVSRSVSRSVSQAKRVERACLVGDARSDTTVVGLLKNHFGVDLVESESGMEFRNDPDMVYICSDFINSHHFKYLHSCGKFILGPAVIRMRAQQSKPLLIPRANRPLYTESMAGVRIALSRVQGSQCREAVNLVHFMGGSAHESFSPNVTHLITDLAKGKTYRRAISMGRRAVHVRWIHSAWAFRDDINKSIVNSEFVNQFLVEPFCGLSLWFIGDKEDELLDMRQKTVEHSREYTINKNQFVEGKLASSQSEATHIVVLNSPDVSVEDYTPKQNLVSSEWFWLSIQLNCCANEEIYQWNDQRRSNRKRAAVLSPSQSDEPNPSSRRINSRSTLNNLETSNSSALADYSEHLFSTDDLEKLSCSPRKTDMRHAVCKEMLETEENYLKSLKLIVQSFKEPLEEQSNNPESGLLTKAEIMQIFSRVPPLIEVHEKICYDLRTYVMHWTVDHLIGEIWFKNAENLRPAYKSFLTNYDTASATLIQCDHDKPKFHAFLKATESREECERNNLKDLLVRPVQRLPSVLLLLRAIQKKTDSKNPDYPEILSSARTLTSELHVLSLGGEDDWAKTQNRNMVIFLFNDLIEIAKVRTGANNETESAVPNKLNATRSFKRQLSFTSFRANKKKYKHHQQYMLTAIRGIDIVTHNDFEGIFVLSFRVSQGEDFWVVQCFENQPGEMRKFLMDLSNQIYYLCGRVTPLENVPLDGAFSITQNNEKWITIGKALHHANRKCAMSSSTMNSIPQKPNRIQRAVSSIHIGFSNTLSRLHSKSNLRSINELSSSLMSPNLTPNQTLAHSSSITPCRRLKNILSTSVFIPPSLGRRDSVRNQMNVSHI